MKTAINTAPSAEPITLAEVNAHLRLDSESFADDLASEQSIAPGSHAVAAAYSLEGAGIDVLGYSALVLLEAGTCGASATVDAKIQESDDDSIYADWAGGGFTQVTEANDNATQEIAYTGSKQYIRIVSTVATAACEFGISVIKDAATAADDTLLNTLITTVRTHTENVLRRKLITQTINGYLDEFPSADHIELPYGNVQSVTSVTYKDSDGDESTMSSDDYIVDTASWAGRIVLGYGSSWPSSSALYPSNPITITWVCGYGDASTNVPDPIRHAMLIQLADLYENREHIITGTISRTLPIYDNLLAPYRMWS